YEASKGGTYVGTSLGLSSVDPVGKSLQLAGGGLFVKMGGKVDGLVAMRVAKILDNPEVKNTLDRIESGVGKYSKDGTTFENRPPVGELESKLPVKEEGYYTEWTVDTPGVENRGARRIVKGNDGEMYYTEDHYLTFIQIN
ncbi:MAG: hypothetical protein GY828_01445, partial [Candidatus Gracilibacteria bacterium]|nr:hypothetical protein [Candidatus Gracilibacteria bacterium]